MKFGRHFTNILLRLGFTFLALVYVTMIVVVVAFGEPAHGTGLWDFAFTMAALAAFAGLWLYMLVKTAPGELTPEGVWLRPFLRRRFYPWAHIRQAGILWRMGRSMHYNEIVLLRSGGSPRKYRDRFFVLRNLFRLIYISYTPEARDFIVRYYGPLDFDLSDGRPEQSIIAD